jgi:hypothetical protein
MSKAGRLVLGFLTVWPLVWTAAWAGVFLSFLSPYKTTTSRPSNPVRLFLLNHLGALIVIFGFSAILAWGLVVFYVVHVTKSTLVAPDRKMLWALALFGGNIIAMPIYWYLYVRKPAPASVAACSVSLL